MTYHYHVHEDLVACEECPETYFFDPSNCTYIKTVDNCCIPGTTYDVLAGGSISLSANADSINAVAGACPDTCSTACFDNPNAVSFEVVDGIPTWTFSASQEGGYIYVQDLSGTFQESIKLCGGESTVSATDVSGIDFIRFVVCARVCQASEPTATGPFERIFDSDIILTEPTNWDVPEGAFDLTIEGIAEGGSGFSGIFPDGGGGGGGGGSASVFIASPSTSSYTIGFTNNIGTGKSLYVIDDAKAVIINANGGANGAGQVGGAGGSGVTGDTLYNGGRGGDATSDAGGGGGGAGTTANGIDGSTSSGGAGGSGNFGGVSGQGGDGGSGFVDGGTGGSAYGGGGGGGKNRWEVLVVEVLVL